MSGEGTPANGGNGFDPANPPRLQVMG